MPGKFEGVCINLSSPILNQFRDYRDMMRGLGPKADHLANTLLAAEFGPTMYFNANPYSVIVGSETRDLKTLSTSLDARISSTHPHLFNEEAKALNTLKLALQRFREGQYLLEDFPKPRAGAELSSDAFLTDRPAVVDMLKEMNGKRDRGLEPTIDMRRNQVGFDLAEELTTLLEPFPVRPLPPLRRTRRFEPTP